MKIQKRKRRKENTRRGLSLHRNSKYRNRDQKLKDYARRECQMFNGFDPIMRAWPKV